MGKSVSSGLLKSTLAAALNLPERKIEWPHRVVQEHGEVSRGKRGRGGAPTNPRDAATTIIAVASSFISDEVIEGVRRFGDLELAHTAHNNYKGVPSEPAGKLFSEEGWTESDGGPWQCLGFQLPHLQSLPREHTFADALTAVIEAARDFAFEDAIKAAHPEAQFRAHNIEVVFWGPSPSAGIEIDLSAGESRYIEQATYLNPNRADTIEDANQAAAFEIRIKIDHQSIYAVAKLFRDGKQ